MRIAQASIDENGRAHGGKAGAPPWLETTGRRAIASTSATD